MIKIAPPILDDITFAEAKMYCFLCTHGGHKDWRLPTSTELRAIVGSSYDKFHTCISIDELAGCIPVRIAPDIIFC